MGPDPSRPAGPTPAFLPAHTRPCMIPGHLVTSLRLPDHSGTQTKACSQGGSSRWRCVSPGPGRTHVAFMEAILEHLQRYQQGYRSPWEFLDTQGLVSAGNHHHPQRGHLPRSVAKARWGAPSFPSCCPPICCQCFSLAKSTWNPRAKGACVVQAKEVSCCRA